MLRMFYFKSSLIKETRAFFNFNADTLDFVF